MKAFKIKVIAIKNTFYDGECIQLILPAIDGRYGVLADHADTVMAIAEGEIRIQFPDGSWIAGDCGMGYAVIDREAAMVIVDTVEKTEII